MKMNKKRPILRRAAIPAVLALLCTLFWFGKPNDFGLGRNMELLVNMMRELSLFYVDEVDPDQLMQDAAEGMTRNLDPYTEFLPEEQMSNFDLLTTGKYGGIGSMIRKKGDYVIFAQPYEGSPADRAGIVQADLADQIDFAEPGDDLFDSPCFRLPGMNPCERGLQSLAGGTVRVDIDYAAFHNADRSEKTKL